MKFCTQKWLLATVLFFCISTSAKVREALQKELEGEKQYEATCTLGNVTIPKDILVYGAGAYAGKTMSGQIDDSGRAASQMDVIVNVKDHPVALILGAYAATVWKISRTPGTTIHSVIVGGYHRQVLVGVDGIPTLVNTYDQKGPCGSFYFTSDEFERLNRLSRGIYNKPADMFFPASKPTDIPDSQKKNSFWEIVIGEKDFDSNTLISPDESALTSFFKTSLSGPAGLKQAVEQGLLRPVMETDAAEWLAALESKEKEIRTKKDIPPVAGKALSDFLPKIPMHNTYVILKDFTFPAGLFGGNSAHFVVAKGVNPPQGDPGHSSVYDMNTLGCYGATLSGESRDWCSAMKKKTP